MCVYGKIVTRTPIDKGWSGDRKFCAITEDGQKYLLRISPMERLERKSREFENMKIVAALGIPMCQPVEFGSCEEGVYAIHSWIDGYQTRAHCSYRGGTYCSSIQFRADLDY